MALVKRYFSTAAAGAGDGTSWANRAAFIVTGTVNTIVSAFDFTSDSLIAYVGPGTYTFTTGIATFTGTTIPSQLFPCEIKACDNSGVEWVPPDPDWVSAQPVWSDTNMPVFATTTNIVTISNVAVNVYGIKFTASARTTNVLIVSRAIWCIGISSISNSTATVVSAVTMLENCCFECSGTAYASVVSATGSTPPIENVRMIGNASASSGTRYGYATTSNSFINLSRCTAANNPGGGFAHTSTGTNARIFMTNCVAVNNSVAGIYTTGTSTSLHTISKCMVTGSGMTNGIYINGTGKAHIQLNRIRDYSGAAISGNAIYCDPPEWGNVTTSGTDADEYVDAGAGDYRIKNTSVYWGMGIGAGDQTAAGGDYTYAQVKQLRYKMRQGART